MKILLIILLFIGCSNYYKEMNDIELAKHNEFISYTILNEFQSIAVDTLHNIWLIEHHGNGTITDKRLIYSPIKEYELFIMPAEKYGK